MRGTGRAKTPATGRAPSPSRCARATALLSGLGDVSCRRKVAALCEYITLVVPRDADRAALESLITRHKLGRGVTGSTFLNVEPQNECHCGTWLGSLHAPTRSAPNDGRSLASERLGGLTPRSSDGFTTSNTRNGVPSDDEIGVCSPGEKGELPRGRAGRERPDEWELRVYLAEEDRAATDAGRVAISWGRPS